MRGPPPPHLHVPYRPPEPAAERWRIVTGVVDAALDLPVEQRREFVASACAEDPALRQSVERLLAACERAERSHGFLEGAAGDFAEPLLAQLQGHVDPAALDVPADLERALEPRYHLERPLGRGGMAVVYLARDTHLGRHVALKVVKPDLAQALGHERFMREIRTVACLTHPHIVPLLETGEAAGTVYFTMPFIAGESLRDKLDREPQLPLEEALSIAAQAADALDCAHRHNVVHRDIKPDNILLADGHAMVADFGVARAIARAGGAELEEKLTGTGVTFGTPAYMSPEQASGDRAIDGRSDVYSLGAVLYEMLAGEPPYRAPSVASLITKILTFPVPSLQVDRPGVPDEVDRLVQRCLAKAPADRFQTAGEVRDALRTVSRGDHSQPSPERVAAPGGIALTVTEQSRADAKRRMPDGSPDTGAGATVASQRRAPRSGRILLSVGMLSILLVSGTAWMKRPDLRGSARVPDELPVGSLERVAVFPFAVHAANSESEFLSEAAMDLLSGAINGVGALRRVDPRAIVHRLRNDRGDSAGDISPNGARDISAAFGARRFVLGAATAIGDRVHLSASLYDNSRGSEPVASANREGRIDDLSLLVTEVARELFAAEPVGTGGRLTSIAAVRAANYAAVRAYLDGEALLRRGANDSASSALRRAVEADSTFALAWYRLAHAEDFRGPGRAAAMMGGLDAAMRHRHRLSQRDRMLVEAYQAYAHGNGTLAERRTLAIVGAYPDDVEAWWLLGVTRLWYAWQRGRSPNEARAPLRRALALDPDHPAALYNSLWLAGFGRRWAEADSLLPRVPRQVDGLQWGAIRSRAIQAFQSGDAVAQARLLQEIEMENDFAVFLIAILMGLHSDQLEGPHRIAGLLTDGARRAERARARGHLLMALTAAAAGRTAEAASHFTQVAARETALALSYQAWVSAVPALQTSREELETLRDSLMQLPPPSANSARGGGWIGLPHHPYPELRAYFLGLVTARIGDRDAALRHAVELETARVPADSAQLLPDLAREIRALVAIGDRQPAEALAILEGASLTISWHYEVSSPLHRRPFGRLLRASLLTELGRDNEAQGWLEAFGSIAGPEFVFLAPVYLRRAQIHERRGEREEAIEYYTRFITRWKDADAVLQPSVDSARHRLAQLTGRPVPVARR